MKTEDLRLQRQEEEEPVQAKKDGEIIQKQGEEARKI